MAFQVLQNEAALLDQLAAGSEEAFNQIYRHFSPAVYDILQFFLKDEHASDELLQVIFIQVWERRKKVAAAGKLEHYLFGMTRNAVFTSLKKRAREGKLVLHYQKRQTATAPNAEDHFHEKQYRQLLHEAVAQLPLQQQKVYRLAAEEELTYEQIAARMSLSRFTVKKHLELARRQVRAYMNHQLHPFVTLPILLLPWMEPIVFQQSIG